MSALGRAGGCSPATGDDVRKEASRPESRSGSLRGQPARASTQLITDARSIETTRISIAIRAALLDLLSGVKKEPFRRRGPGVEVAFRSPVGQSAMARAAPYRPPRRKSRAIRNPEDDPRVRARRRHQPWARDLRLADPPAGP